MRLWKNVWPGHRTRAILFTGIILGPSVFNIASDADAIMNMAEFGVILLMFLIGLELRPQRLVRYVNRSLPWEACKSFCHRLTDYADSVLCPAFVG